MAIVFSSQHNSLSFFKCFLQSLYAGSSTHAAVSCPYCKHSEHVSFLPELRLYLFLLFSTFSCDFITSFCLYVTFNFFVHFSLLKFIPCFCLLPPFLRLILLFLLFLFYFSYSYTCFIFTKLILG